MTLLRAVSERFDLDLELGRVEALRWLARLDDAARSEAVDPAANLLDLNPRPVLKQP